MCGSVNPSGSNRKNSTAHKGNNVVTKVAERLPMKAVLFLLPAGRPEDVASTPRIEAEVGVPISAHDEVTSSWVLIGTGPTGLSVVCLPGN